MSYYFYHPMMHEVFQTVLPHTVEITQGQQYQVLPSQPQGIIHGEYQVLPSQPDGMIYGQQYPTEIIHVSPQPNEIQGQQYHLQPDGMIYGQPPYPPGMIYARPSYPVEIQGQHQYQIISESEQELIRKENNDIFISSIKEELLSDIQEEDPNLSSKIKEIIELEETLQETIEKKESGENQDQSLIVQDSDVKSSSDKVSTISNILSKGLEMFLKFSPITPFISDSDLKRFSDEKSSMALTIIKKDESVNNELVENIKRIITDIKLIFQEFEKKNIKCNNILIFVYDILLELINYLKLNDIKHREVLNEKIHKMTKEIDLTQTKKDVSCNEIVIKLNELYSFINENKKSLNFYILKDIIQVLSKIYEIYYSYLLAIEYKNYNKTPTDPDIEDMKLIILEKKVDLLYEVSSEIKNKSEDTKIYDHIFNLFFDKDLDEYSDTIYEIKIDENYYNKEKPKQFYYDEEYQELETELLKKKIEKHKIKKDEKNIESFNLKNLNLKSIEKILIYLNINNESKLSNKYMEYMNTLKLSKTDKQIRKQEFLNFLKKLSYYLNLKKLILQKKTDIEIIEYIKTNSNSNSNSNYRQLVTESNISKNTSSIFKNEIENDSNDDSYVDFTEEEIQEILDKNEKQIKSLNKLLNLSKLRYYYLILKIYSKLNNLILIIYLYITLFYEKSNSTARIFEKLIDSYKTTDKYGTTTYLYENIANDLFNEDNNLQKILKIDKIDLENENNYIRKNILSFFLNKPTKSQIQKYIIDKINDIKQNIEKNEHNINMIIISEKYNEFFIPKLNYIIKKTEIKDEVDIKNKILELLDLSNDNDYNQEKILGGICDYNNDDFINLKKQIINFYDNDIILKYIYNSDQIILFNYLNFIINKYNQIEKLLENKTLFKLISKNNVNNLLNNLKFKLNFKNNYDVEKKSELLELKIFLKNNDIIIEGFDNFINYLFIYILSVKDNTINNEIIINNNIYNLGNIATLNIYSIPEKQIIIIMSKEEEELAYELLNNNELLMDYIYDKFNYLENEYKEFNIKYLFKINENILNFMNKISNYENDKILNDLKDIEMKIDKINIYGGDNDKKGNDDEDINNYIKKTITNSINTIGTTFNENITSKFLPKKQNPNHNSVIDKIVEKYDNSQFPNELRKYEFYNSIKNNSLDPSVELELTFVDKCIFIVIAYIIRFITLLICYYYIDTDIITDIKISIYYYLIVYIFIFIIIVIIINFDTFKLRILVNYMNLHINTSGIFTHIILVSLFVYLIYLLINNVIGLEQPPTQLTENQKIKLKYKLDILTIIIYGFICIFVLIF